MLHLSTPRAEMQFKKKTKGDKGGKLDYEKRKSCGESTERQEMETPCQRMINSRGKKKEDVKMKAVGQEERMVRMVRMKILLMLYFECKDEADIVPQKNQSHTPLPPPALSNASFLKTSEWKPDEKTF